MRRGSCAPTVACKIHDSHTLAADICALVKAYGAIPITFSFQLGGIPCPAMNVRRSYIVVVVVVSVFM